MKKITVLLIVLLLPLIIPFTGKISADNCFIQIVSVSLNQPSFELGETLQVNLVYDLYYDPLDPLGIGAVTITIENQAESVTLRIFEFNERGISISKIANFSILPLDWAPNDDGQVGSIVVNGWVQDSTGTMTDSIEQQFFVQRSDIEIYVNALPSQIQFHDNITINGSLQNSHNSSISIPNHPITIFVTKENQTVLSWNQNTTQPSNFSQNLDTTQIGTGIFGFNITVHSNEDYISTWSIIPFVVSSTSLTIIAASNTSVVQAYYPLMNNCSVQVTAILNCSIIDHSFEGTTITCTLGNLTSPMTYIEPNSFFAELLAPANPGNYLIEFSVNAPHHSINNTTLPLQVEPRQSILRFEANQSKAAYGDIIGFTLNIQDQSSLYPVENKACSIFLYNQSTWNLLTQVVLDQTGVAHFIWQAQNVGNNDFRFKAVFHGQPEFEPNEAELIVINTHDVRFVLNSTIQVTRSTDTIYLLQCTTLDYQPLSNIQVELIEVITNTTWATALTNASGYANLTWYTASDYAVGIHEFSLVAINGEEILGTILITIIVYEQTILTLL